MKKIIILFLALLIIGGGGFFAFEKWGKTKAETAGLVINDKKVKKETIDTKDEVEVLSEIPVDYVWEYQFKPALDPESLSEENVYVLDEQKEHVQVKVELSEDGETLSISPPKDAYAKGTRYGIHMKKDIKKVTGDTVSKDYEMQFITLRDEVEEGELNPDIKKLKKDEVEVTGENLLKINKDVKIAKDDIIIIPSEEYPEGQALKITTVDSNMSGHTVHVEEPSFDEIYENLNLYKTYPLTDKDITLEDNIEGVKIQSLASLPPSSMVASSTSADEDKVEFKHPSPGVELDINDGFQLSFSNFPIKSMKKLEMALDGTMTFYKPEVHTDISEKGIRDRFEMKSKVNVKSKYKVKVKGKVLEKEIPLTESYRVAKIRIPTQVTGLFIGGDLVMRFNYSLEGGVEPVFYLDYSQSNGFVYENKKIDRISNITAEYNSGLQGSGKAEGRVGPAATLVLEGYGVAAGGIDAFTGTQVTAQAVAGDNEKTGKYACAKIEEKLFAQGSFFIEFLKTFRFEWVFAEKNFGPEQKVNSCNVPYGLKPIKEQHIKSGVTKDVKVSIIQQDLLEQKDKSIQAEMKDVQVTIADEGVATVKKTKKGISIQTSELPEKEKTTITITKKVGRKDETLNIPIVISNYKEIEKKKEKMKEEEEERKKKEELAQNKWNGEWTRLSNSNPGTLNISNYDGSSFMLTMSVLSGANTGDLDGKATVSGKTASFTSQEYDCSLNLTLKDDAVQVEESKGCRQIGGIGTYFSGEYSSPEVVTSTPAPTLYSLGLISEERDGKVQSLVGNDYDRLVKNMQNAHPSMDKYGLEDTFVIEGGVAGMYTFMEGIIIMDPFNHYSVGNLISNPGSDKTILRVYTNDPTYKESMHPVIDTWRSRFSDYPVEYVYKQ